jgi:hypothetical protein
MYIFNQELRDEQGRTVLFRGCTIQPEPGSSAGRPFPLEDAEAHFERLRGWGFSLIRFVITWEVLEHDGPGVYDESYLAYLRKLINLAGEKGVSLIIDPWELASPGKIDEESGQERFLACMRHCFRRLKNCKALIGWGAGPEPFTRRFAERMREANERTIMFEEKDTSAFYRYSGSTSRENEDGWQQPYPMATAGKVLERSWDREQGLFRLRFSADPAINAPTEIYAPPECFGTSAKIEIHAGTSNPAGLAAWMEEGRVFIRNEGYRGDLEIIISR